MKAKDTILPGIKAVKAEDLVVGFITILLFMCFVVIIWTVTLFIYFRLGFD
jgi:hypothetical protein